MNELKVIEKPLKTSVLSTVFSDGMVVNSDDLDTAMRYPLDLLQTLIKAYFGCGVVCGLEVSIIEKTKSEGNSFCLKIKSGVALDCAGFPLKLCESTTINLTPDHCDPCDPLSFENLPQIVCIAIRRETIPEAPRNDGDQCGDNGKPVCQHRREREAVVIKVFKEDCPPDTLCRRPDPVPAFNLENECECLKECGDCNCCGEAWVLLACVKVTKDGLDELNTRVRKYIKPIECLCPPEEKKTDIGEQPLEYQIAYYGGVISKLKEQGAVYQRNWTVLQDRFREMAKLVDAQAAAKDSKTGVEKEPTVEMEPTVRKKSTVKKKPT